MTIAIVDYGMGNLGSVRNMLERVGASTVVTSEPEIVRRAEKLVLPGVGAFDRGMSNLAERGLKEALDEKVLGDRTPILGICLGMQLFTAGSEEGSLPGLGWMDAKTVRFAFGPGQDRLRIPHMGWNRVVMEDGGPLLAGFDRDARFYFVHSYHVECRQKEHVMATCLYGYEFTASVRQGNIFGTQFHPEKSHRFGMQIMKNFTELSRE